MNESKDETLAHMASHIIIRDKDSKVVLLNKNLTVPLRFQTKTIGGMDKNG